MIEVRKVGGDWKKTPRVGELINRLCPYTETAATKALEELACQLERELAEAKRVQPAHRSHSEAQTGAGPSADLYREIRAEIEQTKAELGEAKVAPRILGATSPSGNSQ